MKTLIITNNLKNLFRETINDLKRIQTRGYYQARDNQNRIQDLEDMMGKEKVNIGTLQIDLFKELVNLYQNWTVGTMRGSARQIRKERVKKRKVSLILPLKRNKM